MDWIDEDESDEDETVEDEKNNTSAPSKSSASSRNPANRKRTDANPRRSIRPKNNKPPVIVSDSSPSPDPILNDPIPSPSSMIKEEPEDDDEHHSDLVGRKKNKNSKGKKGDKKEDEEDEDFRPKLEQWLDDLNEITDDKGELKSGHFQKRMDKTNFGAARDWEKYKKVVRKPICLGDIRKRVPSYKSVDDFEKDFQKLIKNAKRVNSEVVNCLAHVDWMEQHGAQWLKTL